MEFVSAYQCFYSKTSLGKKPHNVISRSKDLFNSSKHDTLGHRLRRFHNIYPASAERIVFAGISLFEGVHGISYHARTSEI